MGKVETAVEERAKGESDPPNHCQRRVSTEIETTNQTVAGCSPTMSDSDGGNDHIGLRSCSNVRYEK